MQSVTIVLVTLILVSGLTFLYMIRSRHIERMTRIEHGLDEADPRAFQTTIYSLGIFLISLGLALFASYLIAKISNLPDHILIPGFLLLFGGSSLLLIAWLDRK